MKTLSVLSISEKLFVDGWNAGYAAGRRDAEQRGRFHLAFAVVPSIAFALLIFAVTLVGCGPTAPANLPVTYAGLDAYACALRFMDVTNVQNYSEEVAVCQQGCIQQAGVVCLSCEGQVQNEGWAYCRSPIDSPNGQMFVFLWLDRLSLHPEVMATQQIGIDTTVGIGMAHPDQKQAIGDCDNTADAQFINGVPGCAGRWADMICDTTVGGCPQALPPVALTAAPGDRSEPPRRRQPWDGRPGGHEEFQWRVLDRALRHEGR